MNSPSIGLERPSNRKKVPTVVKVAYTAFVGVLLPCYWNEYGWTNFLWFCDVALLVTGVALWLESSLLASMQAVAITLPQLLWAVDFVVRLVAGVHVVDLTEYMFNPQYPLFVRGLSLFHGWLPFLLLWLVWRLGYDRRAWWAETLLTWAVLLAAYLFVHDPKGPAGNVNKIFGPSDEAAQTWVDPRLWLIVLMVVYPVCLYLPTHWILRWLMPAREAPLPSVKSAAHPG
jgi:hypothetical protein